MSLGIQKHKFLGVSVSAFTKNELVNYMLHTVFSNKTAIIYGYSLGVFYWIKKTPELFYYAEKSDVFVTDGRLFYLLAKHHKLPLKIEISIPQIVLLSLEIANIHGWNIYLLGATVHVNNMAKHNIKHKYKDIGSINGRCGYFRSEDKESIVAEINNSNSQLLFIGISSPTKERIAFEWKNDVKANLIFPCGGMIDVLANKTTMTPGWIKKAGLASLYRFIQEPKRLFVRRFNLYSFFITEFIPLYLYHVVIKKKDFSFPKRYIGSNTKAII